MFCMNWIPAKRNLQNFLPNFSTGNVPNHNGFSYTSEVLTEDLYNKLGFQKCNFFQFIF